MSEQNQHEPERTARPSSPARRPRDPDAFGALRQLDEAQENAHQAARGGASRRDGFPKDDRRSSTLLTERERSERWPLG